MEDRRCKLGLAGRLELVRLIEQGASMRAATPSPPDDRGAVNAKALSTYTGHANISITLDGYGHLMPGNEAEAAGLLDAYLEAAAVPGSAALTVIS